MNNQEPELNPKPDETDSAKTNESVQRERSELPVCRAICPELAGTVITLPDIVKARKRRRRGLIAKLRERTKAVEQLLDIKRHDKAENVERLVAERNEKKAAGPRLKRYFNE